MVLAVLGSVGIGLVWGWLVGGLSHRRLNIFRSIVGVSLGTLMLASVVLYFLEWTHVVWFLGAALGANLMQNRWRQQLIQNRFFR